MVGVNDVKHFSEFQHTVDRLTQYTPYVWLKYVDTVAVNCITYLCYLAVVCQK